MLQTPTQNKNKNFLFFLFNDFIRLISLVIAFGVIGLLGISPLVSAQGTDRGLIISPPIIEASIPEGQKSQYSIRLENDNPTNPIKLKIYLNKVSIDEQDSPLLEPIESQNPLTQIIQLPTNELSLAPKEVKNLDFIINQPINSPSGNLVAIIFEPIISDSATNGIDIKQRLSSLIFVQTPQKENDQIPKYQVIKAKADLNVIDPFLDSYSLNYQVYNPTPRFVKVDPLINQIPNEKSVNRKTILPFGTRAINITNPSPIQAPRWLQNLFNPRLDTTKISVDQNLTGGTIFGEKVWNLNDEQPETVKVKVFFLPWKTGLLVVILITMIISLYYFGLWFLAKIKINGRELVSTPHISKRLPVIICFGIGFLCLTLLLVTQMVIPRVELTQAKIETSLPFQETPANEISLNNNFAIDPLIMGRGFKTSITPKTITIDDANCQAPELPARVNGCYLDIDLTKITTPKNTAATNLILSQLDSSDIQVTAKSKDGQDIILQATNQDRGEIKTVNIDINNPNIDTTKPMEIRFWQKNKNQPIVIDNLIASYK